MKNISLFLISILFSSTAMAGMVWTYVDPSGKKIVVTTDFSNKEKQERGLKLVEAAYTPPTPPPAPAIPLPIIPSSSTATAGYGDKGNVETQKPREQGNANGQDSLKQAKTLPAVGTVTYSGHVRGVVFGVSNPTDFDYAPTAETPQYVPPVVDPVVARNQRLIELEKARLQERRGVKSPVSSDWNNYHKKLIDKRIRQLENNPEQYFYDKEQRDKIIRVNVHH